MKYIMDKENLKLLLSVVASIIASYIISFVSRFIALLFSIVVISFLIYRYFEIRDKRVEQLSNYLKQLNNNNYHYDITAFKEGELSKLISELNKTTIYVQNLNNQLNEQSSFLNKSLEDMAHQIKTPVSSLILLNDLQEDSLLVSKSRDQLVRLNYLSESLLKLIRLDTNIETFNMAFYPISDILNNVNDLIISDSIKIIINCKNEHLYCDISKIQEAIINIVSNKLRYADSSITISVNNTSLQTFIRISDDGTSSIDNKEQENIFQRFYSGNDKDSKSIGIGLSLAKEYVSKQSGDLYVEDENTFVMRFYRRDIT